MQIKNLTLGLSLLLTGSALAQQQTHIVKPGDTVGGIAGMFNARALSILKANGLQKNAHLTVGRALTIPNATIFVEKHYTVHNGDCDWTIARKFNTSVHKLHLSNPEIHNWDALRNGLSLKLPGSMVSAVSPQPKHEKAPAVRKVRTSSFVVSEDDNDWVIAHHLGVSLKQIHELNPGINWNRLRAGKRIIVPVDGGSNSSSETKVAKASTSSKIKINRIRTRYAVVNSDAVLIRRDARAHAKKITTVDTGTRVVVLDRDGAWYKLRFPRGTEGWVRGDFLNPSHAPVATRRRHSSSSETRVASRHRRHRNSGEAIALDTDARSNPIVKNAVAMLGTPYSYGSSSRSGTDCSGFTWQTLKTQGVHLPRTSREQSRVGQAVKSSELKPGDLLFFGSRNQRGVHHVAIYVGKGKFIHASSGGGKVQFNSLNDDYYRNHYKGARRVVKTTQAKHVAPKAKHSTSTASVDTNPTPLGK